MVDLAAEESGGEVTLRRPTGTSRLIVPMPSREGGGLHDGGRAKKESAHRLSFTYPPPSRQMPSWRTWRARSARALATPCCARRRHALFPGKARVCSSSPILLTSTSSEPPSGGRFGITKTHVAVVGHTLLSVFLDHSERLVDQFRALVAGWSRGAPTTTICAFIHQACTQTSPPRHVTHFHYNMGDEAAENLRLMIEFAKRGQIPQIEGFLDEQVPINGVDHLGCTGTEPRGFIVCFSFVAAALHVDSSALSVLHASTFQLSI